MTIGKVRETVKEYLRTLNARNVVVQRYDELSHYSALFEGTKIRIVTTDVASELCRLETKLNDLAKVLGYEWHEPITTTVPGHYKRNA